MKCQFCNTELEDDALSCHECGAKTGESPAEEPGEEIRKCSGCGAELNRKPSSAVTAEQAAGRSGANPIKAPGFLSIKSGFSQRKS